MVLRPWHNCTIAISTDENDDDLDDIDENIDCYLKANAEPATIEQKKIIVDELQTGIQKLVESNAQKEVDLGIEIDD